MPLLHDRLVFTASFLRCSRFSCVLRILLFVTFSLVQETQVWSLGWEHPLKKKLATHFSILACRIPWTEEPGELLHSVAKSWTQLSN